MFAAFAFACVVAVLGSEDNRGEVVLYASAPEAAARDKGFATLVAELRARGLAPVWRDTAALAADRERVHIVLDAATLPLAKEKDVIDAVLGGGRWIFLGTPAWSDPALPWEGGVAPRSKIKELIQAIEPSSTAIAFRPDRLASWSRSTNMPDRRERHEVVETERGLALHAVVEDLGGWDTLTTALAAPIPASDNLTIFWARGDAATTALSVELREGDGSRWIATVPLEPRWRKYVLTEEDFPFWESRPDRARTTLVLGRVRECAVGVAFSHTGPRTGRHEYWIASIGTAAKRLPEGYRAGPKPFPGLCPEYQFFQTKAAVVAPRTDFPPLLELDPNGASVAKTDLLRCLHPRPSGQGIERDRPFRYIPLLDCFDTEFAFRGTCAALFVGSKEPYLGAAWASFPQPPALIGAQPFLAKTIAAAAAALADGVFLMSAGADRFTYFPDQTATIGADVVNCGTKEAVVDLLIRGVSPDPSPPAPRRLAAGGTWIYRDALPAADFRRKQSVRWRVYVARREVDRIQQTVHLLKLPENPKFTTVGGAHFSRDGKRWRPLGINYMPSSGIGLEDWRRFERWLGGPAYDPEIIRRDLERVKAIGFDAVSIFLYDESHGAGNLVDFLRLCRELGLAVNLSLRPGTPVEYPWPAWRRMIVENRLASNDTVFAYDVAWEPGFRSPADLRALDNAWAAWVSERYGSPEAAERAWGFALPRKDGGAIVGPSGRMLWNEGPWRSLVSAYRRFVDDFLAKRYRVAARRIKDVDPNHLVSYRMAESGDPTFRNENCLPYGFTGGARVMDFLGPEAYGRIGTWEGAVRPGVFTVAYARAVAPEKPVLWAEIGMSIWDRAAGRSDPDLADRQGTFFDAFFRLLRASDADGVFFWWYPGGFRVNEYSDFGVINPDGTWRPATQAICKFAGEGWGDPPKPGSALALDAETFDAGLDSVWNRVSAPFIAEVEAGKLPRVELWPANMTSATVPPLAVGGLKLPDGIVPRHLNGLFEKTEAMAPGEGAVDLAFGGTVAVKRGAAPIAVRVSAVNTAPCSWLAEGDRAITVVAVREGDRAVREAALPRDVPYLGNAEVVISLPAEKASWKLYLTRRDGLAFGERIAIEITVAE